MRVVTGLALGMAIVLCMTGACAQEGARILFLSKSQGFEHGPVAEKDGQPSVAAQVLDKLATANTCKLTATKNASAINAENLKNYDMVVFYTQGDLTQPSKDGGDNMSPDGVKALLDWISAGGAFMAFHSGSDTFHSNGSEISPYIKMVGGEFVTHGAQFEGTIKIVDPEHPAVVNFSPTMKVNDEWYLFNNINKETMHVLALLDPGDEGAKQDKYKIAPYPMIWCSAYGKGKVYFNGMGHNPEMWLTQAFQDSIVDAAEWCLEPGINPAHVAPNYDKVVKEEPKK